MLVVVHNQYQTVQILHNQVPILEHLNQNCTTVFPVLAQQFPNEILVWCHEKVVPNVNFKAIENLLTLENTMLSFQPDGTFLPKAIGYVEDSVFINFSKKVKQPTWQMSSYCGAMATNVIQQIPAFFWNKASLDVALHQIAKTYQPLGLFCYSEPQLLQNPSEIIPEAIAKANWFQLFEIVRLHYKWIWSWLLLFALFWFEKKVALFPFLTNIFKKKVGSNVKSLSFCLPNITEVSVSDKTVDVVIPTIGRKEYLHQMLLDLSVQTLLPKNVIIVEQNPDISSSSELDFLTSETWPFAIKHHFTHQAGACNARNLALEHISSDWVFLADDDIRFEADLIAKTLQNCTAIETNAVTLSCLKPDERQTFSHMMQWSTFGSGCSFVKRSVLETVQFDVGFEFGFGEDADFGKQIRQLGYDIIYLPEPRISHLKAPMGGFRTKPKLRWHEEIIQPKPSPTVLLYHLKHHTKEQINGYKLVLFLKYYRKQTLKNPFTYYKKFQKQWQISMKWAIILQQEHEK